MATNTRKLSDFLAEGEGDTFGDLAVVGEPHIKPGTLYPAWSGLLEDNTGHTFTDSSPSAHALTPTGQVHHSGVQEKVGSTSLKFDGSTAYLEAPASADWNFGSGDATIECWFYPTSSSGVQRILSSQSAGLWILWWNRNGNRKVSINGNVVTESHSSNAFSLNTWHHAAITKIGTAIKLYVNGVQEIAVTASGNFTDTSATMIAGAYSGDGSEKFNGYIDEIRICKGLAVYTGAFTPQTTALTTTWSAGTNIAANSTASNVKLLINSDNGGHSGAYGTAQSDGKKYYYTDIKGSKPIKDPRIGAHFGSQRHKFKSLQKLEQETASAGKASTTYGSNVYSVDGREWVRAISGTSDWRVINDSWGNYINNPSTCTGAIIEIVGYFNDINFLHSTHTDRCDDVDVYVNGTISVDGSTTLAGDAAVASPLGARYVDPGSVINGGSTLSTSLGTTPKINTLKFEAKTGSSEHLRFFGIELIAQDTTSTANKSKIQIPSQNVVSYGKKFTVSGTPHYDPFNGFTSGTDISGYIDTATSLGMSNWKVTSTWYRPFNGGRVVKWIDSSGNIKTSVTMMPPNAQNIGNTASNAIDLSSSQTNDDTINFNTSVIDHSLSEVAKTFHCREFGNGAANGGTTSASYPDVSMLNAEDNIAYIMDDGLTSHYGFGVRMPNYHTMMPNGTNDNNIFTFIGTGVTNTNYENAAGTRTIAQNLPYGTHILKMNRNGSNAGVYTLDGVSVGSTASHCGEVSEITFHQPKRPPIPEDACIIADYMLMADFVKQGDAEETQISAGVRSLSATRDCFCNDTGSRAFYNDTYHTVLHDANLRPFGFLAFGSHASTQTSYAQLPFFGTHAMVRCQSSDQAHLVDFGPVGNMSSSVAWTALDCSTQNGNDVLSINTSLTLGMNEVKAKIYQGGYSIQGFDIASPIHTSSHYQSFETPFLHELVGGDRNMEQNNLVVTADGKTWDEVTRDMSYLGPVCVSATTNADTVWANPIIYSEWRGIATNRTNLNKDFAIAYDRTICLVDGWYNISIASRSNGEFDVVVYLNGTSGSGPELMAMYGSGSENEPIFKSISIFLKRGDFLYTKGEFGVGATSHNFFEVKRIKRI